MTEVLVSKLQVLQKSILRVIVNRCTLNSHICTDIIRSTSQGIFLPLGFSPQLYSVVGTNNNFSFLSFLFCITKSFCKNFSLIGAYKYPPTFNLPYIHTRRKDMKQLKLKNLESNPHKKRCIQLIIQLIMSCCFLVPYSFSYFVCMLTHCWLS